MPAIPNPADRVRSTIDQSATPTDPPETPLDPPNSDTAGWGTMQTTGDIEVSCDHLTAGDGTSLFYRAWINRCSPEFVLCIHGLGGHSGWYIELGNFLASHGVSVIIPDLRGFGRSGGPRGHVRRASQYLHDLQLLIQHARAHLGAQRLHLIGHSMGAVLTIHLALRSRPTSITLINPWVEDNQGVAPGLVLQILAGGAAGSGRLYRLAGGAEGMSGNPAARDHINADSLWVREESATFFTQIFALRLRTIQAARKITAPALVIQTADDTVLRHRGSRRLFNALGSPHKVWSDSLPGWHDFQFDADRTALEAAIIDWINSHSDTA